MKIHQNQLSEAKKENLKGAEKQKQLNPQKVDKSLSPIDLSKIIEQN